MEPVSDLERRSRRTYRALFIAFGIAAVATTTWAIANRPRPLDLTFLREMHPVDVTRHVTAPSTNRRCYRFEAPAPVVAMAINRRLTSSQGWTIIAGSHMWTYNHASPMPFLSLEPHGKGSLLTVWDWTGFVTLP